LNTPSRFITTDIARFCETLSALYGNIAKPVLDMLIFTAQLSSSLGPMGTVGLFGCVLPFSSSPCPMPALTIALRSIRSNYFLTAALLRSLTPAFGTLAAGLARLEGEYRAAVARIGINAEEISFYKGGLREKGILDGAWLRLKAHWEGIARVRVGYSMAEDFIIKYAFLPAAPAPPASAANLLAILLTLRQVHVVGRWLRADVDPQCVDLLCVTGMACLADAPAAPSLSRQALAKISRRHHRRR